MSAMRTGVLLCLLMTGVAFCTEPAADADSGRQSHEPQDVSLQPPLRLHQTPDTLFLADTSREMVPCIVALEVLEAVRKGRGCEETAPCLALGFVLAICLLLVLNGIMHH